MYNAHFGLRAAPFSLTPDTSFYCNLASHHEALNLLRIALGSGEGFVKIVGEVGTGKTLLCRKLLSLIGEGVATAYIPDPFLGAREIRMALAEELGLLLPSAVGGFQLTKYTREILVDIHRRGGRCALVIDEAQAMPTQSLDSLRLLSNLETESAKLLQVVLFAQPELDQRLAEPGLRQLQQRIAFSCRLRSLDRRAVGHYVTHRLRVAGFQGERLFAPRALSAIHRASRGIPRLVNILCHKSLICAYGRGDREIVPLHVRRAAADTESVARRQGRGGPHSWVMGAA